VCCTLLAVTSLSCNLGVFLNLWGLKYVMKPKAAMNVECVKSDCQSKGEVDAK
jgi:hypothetical protein